MDNKIIIIGLIIIVLAVGIILTISQENTYDLDDYNQCKNNTSDNNLSIDSVKNSSLNTDQITKYNKNSISGMYDGQTTQPEEKSNYMVIINNLIKRKNDEFSSLNNNSNTGDESKLIKITSDDIKKYVEDRVYWGEHGDNVRIGEPYLLSSYSSDEVSIWLVPAFNKTSGEFAGSVMVTARTYKNSDGVIDGLFSPGVDSYSDYHTIISGKPIPKRNATFIAPNASDLNITFNSRSINQNDVVSDKMLEDVKTDIDLTDLNIDLRNSSKSCCE